MDSVKTNPANPIDYQGSGAKHPLGHAHPESKPINTDFAISFPDRSSRVLTAVMELDAEREFEKSTALADATITLKVAAGVIVSASIHGFRRSFATGHGLIGPENPALVPPGTVTPPKLSDFSDQKMGFDRELNPTPPKPPTP